MRLALLLVGGLVLALAVGRLVHSPRAQLMILAGYGLAAMAWALYRIRRLSQEVRHGPQ